MLRTIFVVAFSATLFFVTTSTTVNAYQLTPRTSSVTGSSCNADGTANVTISWDLEGSFTYTVQEALFGPWPVPFPGYYKGCSYVLAVAGNLPFPSIGCTGSYTFNNLIQNNAYSYGFHISIGPRWSADPSSGYVGLGWYNLTTPACTPTSPTSPTSPPAPTSMSYSCAAGGTSVTFSWPAAPGASVYYPRFSTTGGSCPSGWTMWTDGTTCYSNSLGAQSVSAAITPGTSYSNAWVHSGDPVDFTKVAQTGAFTCVATPTMSTASCSGGTATLNWTPVAGATKYHPIIRYPTPTTCPTGWTPWGVSTTDCKQDGITGTSDSAPGLPLGTYEAFVYAYGTAWSAESNHVSFSCGPTSAGPDLSVGAISPTMAVAGLPTTFSAMITNSGLSSTVVGFNNLFQVATGLDGLGNGVDVRDVALSSTPNLAGQSKTTNIWATAMGALGGSSSATASASYTFPSTGSYYMRVCADKASVLDVTGVVAEENENNNCGPWTAVAVSGASCIPACTGGAVCTAGSCVASCTPGNACTSAANSCGMTASGVYSNSCSCSGTVPSNTLCPSVTLLSASSRVRSGQPATLSWSSLNVSSCSLVSNPIGFSSSALTGTNVSTSPLVITGNTTFTLMCTAASGAVSTSVQVGVLPGVIEK